MRTNNNNLIDSIIGIITNIDLHKTKDIVDRTDKTVLLDYINKEFLNLKEYKTLMEDIKLRKEDILEMLYQMLTLVNTSTDKYNNTSETEQLIKKANDIGFTWPNSNSCFNKVEEEFLELKNAIKKNDENNIKEEIGDLLFTLHCYANIKKFNFKQILNDANTKFELRFKKLLEIARIKNIDLENCSAEIKEKLWKVAKNSL
jgi:phosphoribosyl-ATP pyrophosphohydrolase